ncbi:hypothetical protein LUZ60_001551 [Juncus effusus]|nr:hypothetical protein LUZ60_001551 [Juncus effusus]
MAFHALPSLLLLAFILYKCSKACSACWAEEKTALLEIKASISVPGSSGPLKWDDRVDCCRWEGVSCDSVTGRIIQLLLNYTWGHDRVEEFNQLNSTLFLPFLDLQYLDLSGNSINGCVPNSEFEAWSSLRKLEVLDLSWNQFNESIIEFLVRLSKLNLEVLDLSFNSFSGILGDMGNWPSLKALSLSGNSLYGTLPTEEFSKMINLKELDLSQNEFTGDLTSCMGNLSSLTFLDLSQNQIRIKFPNSIFTNMTSLEHLSLSGNQIEGILYLNSFSNHSKLKILELSSQSNNFHVETEFLMANPSFLLEGLELSNCNLNKKNNNNHTWIVPSFLLNQYELYYLDLSHNNLGGSFPNWLVGNNINLLHLNLRNNSFEGSLVFPSQIKSNLTWLDASQNKLFGELPNDMHIKIPSISLLNVSRNSFQGPLPSSFKNLSSIYVLDISHNNISDHIENAFLGNLSNIIFLYISNNRFYGSLPSLEKAYYMIDLALDNNFITGEIPNNICNITEATYIDMSNNKLNGTIPSCVGKNRNLGILNLRNNSLEGPIPTAMCKLTSLQFLDLSRNNLSGPIPSCFNISWLQYLHLSQNSFSGQFPISLSSSRNLISLDIRGNKFSGTIPNWINASFLTLRVLLLGANHFDGTLPDQICDLKYLLILDISHNSLSGQIPTCLSKMGSDEGAFYYFQYVDYSESDAALFSMPFYDFLLKNYLKSYETTTIGVDQEEFMTKSRSDYYQGNILNYLSGIDLSSNLLEGSIPKGLGSMNWILALNISNNRLSGKIPKSLSNLTDLESLDLSHNDLTGQIPTELAKLHFLESFSVAYNNLSGAILNGDQFSSFGESSFEGNPNLCGPPLLSICANVSPASPNGDGNSKDNDDWFDLLMMAGSFVVSFVLGFWGFIVVIYYKRNWNRALFLAVDKYTDLIIVKITLLMRRMRTADQL